jgi:hypothetical protein
MEIKEKYGITLTDKWFDECTDAFDMMNGLAE